ncbi:MAG: ATPase, T2SS/T4P/T4SS family [Eubacteriales bacterium]|nr:ATPase, T2SS/T4P/T4SS family [Eubacteriales bacterium]MDD3882225.1 ATPase, T2SS/T4P/T4SS family [Eubacteriales bacterium]MDD4512574.1 ATPase, T2SS/T4P/T4SS family [Eubacteriales bacterium]
MDDFRLLIAQSLPERAQARLLGISESEAAGATEIRISTGGRAYICVYGKEILLAERIYPDELLRVIHSLCGHALYARQRSLSQGYFTMSGGHRVGVCGHVETDDEKRETLLDVSSVCIRIAKPRAGLPRQVSDALMSGGKPCSVIILGAPGSGKTTLLRAASEALSDKYHLHTGIADERGEIAACENGTPLLPVGIRADVVDSLRKSRAMRWLLRSMQPDVILTDEIASQEDSEAITDIARCGVALVCTAHAATLSDFTARPVIGRLWKQGIFSAAIVLSGKETGQVSEIVTWEEWPC